MAQVSKKGCMVMSCSFIPSMVGFEVQRALKGFTEPASAFPNYLGKKETLLIYQHKRVAHYSPLETGQNSVILKLNLKAIHKIIPYSVR